MAAAPPPPPHRNVNGDGWHLTPSDQLRTLEDMENRPNDIDEWHLAQAIRHHRDEQEHDDMHRVQDYSMYFGPNRRRSADGLTRTLQTTDHAPYHNRATNSYHAGGRRIPFALPNTSEGGLVDAGPSHAPQQAADDDARAPSPADSDRTVDQEGRPLPGRALSPAESDRAVDEDGFPRPSREGRAWGQAWARAQHELEERVRVQTYELQHARYLQRRMRREN